MLPRIVAVRVQAGRQIQIEQAAGAVCSIGELCQLFLDQPLGIKDGSDTKRHCNRAAGYLRVEDGETSFFQPFFLSFPFTARKRA